MPLLPSRAPDVPLAPIGRPEALLERAKEAHQAGRRDEAIRLFRRILAIDPMNAVAAGLLGMVLVEAKQLLPAIAQFEQSLMLNPKQPDIWLCRGMALADTGRLPDALASFERALSLRHDYDLAQVNRAATLYRLGRFQESLVLSEALAKRLPHLYGLGNGYAMTLQWCGTPEATLNEYNRTIALVPDDPTGHVNKAMFLIYTGDLAAGFREYEWRWRDPATPIPEFARTTPHWLGEGDIAGKTVLFYEEQGFGDTLQFCRYVVPAARAGARVILRVQRTLAELLAAVPGISRIVTDDEDLPEHDLRCPMLSLPVAFGTTIETIPAEVPYLRADPSRVAVWRDRLSSIPGPRVGLVWAGSWRFGKAEDMAMNARRSMPLTALAPLVPAARCSFVSLQLGPAAEEVRSPPAGMILHDHTGELVTFADTAALIENLDLVISVDTAVAHLAGAMGKPVWLMNRFDSCWRWLRDRDDSPWYPTMRQFRQSTPGNWIDVVDRVAAALRDFVSATVGEG
jgi:Tfp pilus assembly protein PilF